MDLNGEKAFLACLCTGNRQNGMKITGTEENMKKWIVMAFLGGATLSCGGVDLSQYEHLKEPQITKKSDSRMLVVTASGAPSKISGKAIGVLFKYYYKLDSEYRVGKHPAPIARWPVSLDTPQEQWVGKFALPVSENLKTIPTEWKEEGATLAVETWHYGDVAEILHVGPYDREKATVDRLHDFVKKQGWVISGVHEEEYVKGPGWIFAGDPENYYTIIRYPVKKR